MFSTHYFESIRKENEMSELKIGDVVQLKSGGPSMTIRSVGTTALCEWFDNATVKSNDFAITSLQTYKEPIRRRARVIS